MGEAFFTEVDGPDPVRRPRRRRPARVQGLPAGPAGPRARGWRTTCGPACASGTRSRGRASTCSASGRSTGRGSPRRTTRWTAARTKMAVAFEFFEKLGTPYYCFHDRDVAPEGGELRRRSAPTSTRWPTTPPATRSGPACGCCGARPTCSPTRATRRARRPTPIPRCSRSRRRRSSTCSRSPSGSAAQNYVLWGGREGYDTLLNTDLRREGDQLARFLHLVAEHKHEDRLQGPAADRAQADGADEAPVRLRRRDRARLPRQPRARGRVPDEHRGQPRHARRPQLPPRGRVRGRERDAGQHRRQPRRPAERLGHRPVPELGGGPRAAAVRDPARRRHRARRLQLRRQAAPPEHATGRDLFHAHIGGLDTLARALLVAADLVERGELAALKDRRYAGWDGELGSRRSSAAR